MLRPKRLAALLAVTLLVGTAVSALSAAAPEGTGITWQTDLRKAHETAVRENKPMLIVFGADWCGYCKKLERETLANPQMVKYVNAEFVPVHLDADKDKEALDILEVRGLPCSVVLSPNADLLGRIEGYQKTAPYYSKLVSARRLHTGVAPTAANVTAE
ncbi:thiol:disulfide interchange protein precursor [Maioricimonas rarisocia]|uniref:Thiol:disulfide interchange protein n=1 Tax=Maioricimonas rarisocia TaxID=2528026 RepID=A0A517Z2D7_9PLAN|nr:thioredoxin family protein [Maioricimonas rarisocia]QDU36635.1 thiol:disulfide interchange protein precursor [Maioricimonas rarisocia]